MHGKMRVGQCFVFVGLVVACLAGVIAAQTFQYSRGWTNGKRSMAGLLDEDHGSQDVQIYGLCHMQRLRQVLDPKHGSEMFLPCEVVGRDDVLRVRRNAGSSDATSYLTSFPTIKN